MIINLELLTEWRIGENYIKGFQMDFFSRERFPMFGVIETVFTEYTAPTVSEDVGGQRLSVGGDLRRS